MLTLGLIWAEKTSERKLDGVGWSSGRTAMAAATETFDSAGIRLKRARGGVETVDGKAAGLWTQRIEAGRRAVADATNGGDSARLGSHELEDGDGRGGRDGAGRFEGVREDTSSAQTSRIAGIADTWRRRRRAQAPVWPASVTVETLSLQ